MYRGVQGDMLRLRRTLLQTSDFWQVRCHIFRPLTSLGVTSVFFLLRQEMDVMNTLLAEIVRSLKELQLGFAGELTMSDAMEGLMDALYLDKVCSLLWRRVAHISSRQQHQYVTRATVGHAL